MSSSSTETASERVPLSLSDSEEELFPPPPPPNFEWKRPTLLLVTPYVYLYMRAEVLKQIKTCLQLIGGEAVVDRFKASSLGHLIDVRRGYSASNALHHILARQLDSKSIPSNEQWFHIGGRTIRFTAQDYALVTGLRFGGSDFDPNVRHPIPSNGIYHRHFRGCDTRVSELRSRFTARKLGKNVDDYLKAANLLVYYLFLLCRDDIVIENWAWALVEDTKRWDMFPWGSFSYQTLCYYIDNVAMLPSQINKVSYHFYGPVWAFQIWSYEAIPKLGRMCGTRDTEISLPRCLMWTTKASKAADFTHFFEEQLDTYEQLEPMPVELGKIYLACFQNGDPFAVHYEPPVRIATKKEPARKEESVVKTVGKMKCRDTSQVVAPTRRSAQTEPEQHINDSRSPEPARSLRKRHKRTSPAEETDLTCCVHGLHCGDSGRDNDMDARLARIVARKLSQDEFETGLIARVARRVSDKIRDLIRPRPSNSPPVQSDASFGDRFVAELAPEGPCHSASPDSHRRSATHESEPDHPHEPAQDQFQTLHQPHQTPTQSVFDKVEVELRIKVVINKQKNKVLFAEAGSDFTDVLLSFLLLPLGTIVKVLEQHYGDKTPVIGSLNTLYNGVANFDSIHFETEASKRNLLIPTTHYESELCKLRLNVNCPQPTSSSSVESYDGVFTQSSATFIIGDDLRVMPNMAGSFIETLGTLGIALTDMDGVETRNVTFGLNEVMALLKESLISLNPLTALVFHGSQMILARERHILLHQIDQNATSKNSKKMILKVLLQKSTNKLLFAQADYEFINFLFGLLTIPLGKVEWYLGSITGIKTMDNLHRSISGDSNKVYLKNVDAQVLLTMSNYHVAPNEFYHLNFEPDAKNHHVKGARMYMVSDDLIVAPLAMTSCLSVFNGVKISASDVEERELQVGLEEGLSILKAALTSTTPLTDGLIKPKLKVSLSSNSAQSVGIVNQTPRKRPKLEC